MRRVTVEVPDGYTVQVVPERPMQPERKQSNNDLVPYLNLRDLLRDQLGDAGRVAEILSIIYQAILGHTARDYRLIHGLSDGIPLPAQLSGPAREMVLESMLLAYDEIRDSAGADMERIRCAASAACKIVQHTTARPTDDDTPLDASGIRARRNGQKSPDDVSCRRDGGRVPQR